jgi:hypothetical protein
MKNRTLLFLYVAIAVNIALVLLPTYDAANIRSWIALGSTVTNAAPAMADNIGRAAFSLSCFYANVFGLCLFEFNVYLAVCGFEANSFIFTC